MSPRETPFSQLTPEEQIVVRTTGFTWDWHVQFSPHQISGMLAMARIILGKESIHRYIKSA